MAPYITPWAVMGRAGISSFAAVSTNAWMRLAPSSSEYSVWLCRWMKVFGACGIVWIGCGGPRDKSKGDLPLHSPVGPGVELAPRSRGATKRAQMALPKAWDPIKWHKWLRGDTGLAFSGTVTLCFRPR